MFSKIIIMLFTLGLIGQCFKYNIVLMKIVACLLCLQISIFSNMIYLIHFFIKLDFPGGSDGKASCLQCGRPGFDPWVGKIPWRRKWQPTPVLLPGKSHGQRSLVGYSPRVHKEADTTERLHFHFLSLNCFCHFV